MGLFKSKDERRIERDLEIRKGLASIKRNIKQLEKHEKEYLKKAQRAKQINSGEQLGFLKGTLKRTAAQRRMLERQLLHLETVMQMKNQAESHAQFAQSMGAMSKSIAEAFGAVDFEETQKEFQNALTKAETMEERMELFLDLTASSLGDPVTASEDMVSDEEIDAMIEEGAAETEGAGLDEEIARGLGEIEKELGK